MAEATDSVHLTKLRTRLHHATITLALQAAMKITKHQLRAQGLKPMHMPHRELRVRAEAYNLRVWDGVRVWRSGAHGMCVSGRGSWS